MEFRAVVEQYAAQLYRLAFSYCGNRQDAEDVLQEVFEAYFRSAPAFDAPQQRTAWLMTATANQCKDLLRSSWRRKRQPLSELPELAAPTQEHDDTVRRALDALPEKYRGIVYLFYYEEYSTAQIAQALGLPPSTVRTRLERARKLLKRMLGGEDDGE